MLEWAETLRHLRWRGAGSDPPTITRLAKQLDANANVRRPLQQTLMQAQPIQQQQSKTRGQPISDARNQGPDWITRGSLIVFAFTLIAFGLIALHSLRSAAPNRPYFVMPNSRNVMLNSRAYVHGDGPRPHCLVHLRRCATASCLMKVFNGDYPHRAARFDLR